MDGADSVRSGAIPENWVVNDKPLGTEHSANHITTESLPGVLCSTIPKTSVIGYLLVSHVHSPLERRVKFAAQLDL